MNPVKISKAVEILGKDGVCIFPTDTVYGLFCSAYSKRAVSKVYGIKGRSKRKPLQLFLSDKNDIFKYAKASPSLKTKIKKMLPGPYTVILKLKPEYSKSFSFLKTGTAGFRVIKSSFIKSVIESLGGPVAATSANISGHKTPVKFRDIEAAVARKTGFAVKDDKQVRGIPSKVVDFTGEKEKVLRP